ncbi:hypothetical protein RZE84_00585 [Mollicutes bacterium LVI A0075]|nr:hypothetical protein RZE84_00585 [Mollicutes bacterium LVI A0075]
MLTVVAVLVILGGLFAYKVTDIMGIFAAGNDSKYDLENVDVITDSPLDEQKIIFLGSSVTDGMQSRGISFVDYIGKRDNVDFIKEAVSEQL